MPNLESIIITNCIGIAVVILTLVSSVETRRSKTPDTRLLTVMLLMIALSCFMEALSYIVDGKTWSSARALGMLSNTWLYLSNPTFAAIWCLYVDYRMYQSLNRLKRFRPLLMLTGFIWLTIIGNIFGGYLFIIDEQNFYHRLPLAYVYFAIPFLYVGISIADVYGYKRRHGGLSFFPIWVFVILFMIGCIIQASFYGISVAWCCLALAVAGVYMSLQNQLLYHDPLTGLYNRYYLNYMFSSTAWGRSGTHAGIMLDVDEFKSINDRFGHSVGDLALRDTADILKENIPDNSIAIRYAGDEFIVLMRTGDPKEAEAAARNIQNAVQAFNGQNKRVFQLSLSMGLAFYQAGVTSQDRFLEEMDQLMYKDKQKKYEGGSLSERRRERKQPSSTE